MGRRGPSRKARPEIDTQKHLPDAARSGTRVHIPKIESAVTNARTVATPLAMAKQGDRSNGPLPQKGCA